MVLNISTKFHESIQEISKGHNSLKIKMEIRFFFSAHRLMIYICIKIHENSLNGI